MLARWPRPLTRTLLLWGVLATSGAGLAIAADWSTLTQTAATSTDRQADTQREIDRLDDAAQEAYSEYRSRLIELEGLRTYNRQLQALRDEQDATLADLEERIRNTGHLDRQLLPLMERMHEALGTLIAEDLPFLRKEREARQIRLREILNNPELSLASKYRSMYEAFQIELDYGNTLEAYTDQLELEGDLLTVTMLRVGRIGLYAMSVDHNLIYAWDRASAQWVRSDGLENHLEKALRMAKKQVAPDLLVLSVPAPTEAP